jgi:hypothetical protein
MDQTAWQLVPVLFRKNVYMNHMRETAASVNLGKPCSFRVL